MQKVIHEGKMALLANFLSMLSWRNKGYQDPEYCHSLYCTSYSFSLSGLLGNEGLMVTSQDRSGKS